MAALPRFTLPLPAADFLRDHWQRKPLVARSAATGLDQLDPDTLAGLSLEEGVESRLIQGAGNGPWSLRHGPFSEQDFQTLPERDWTLLVQSVDHCLTDVSLLLDCFDFLPGWRIEDIMVSYAVRGGSVGPHFDQYDVFLIQASGHRRWQIGPVCDADTPRLPHDSLKLLADMPVQEEHLLGPGDVLYLPPGVAHHGVAEDDDCVTWSVGFRAPRLADLLARITDEALADTPDRLFSDAGRTLPGSPGLLSEADATALAEQALSLISPALAQRALAQLLSEPRHPGLDFEVDSGHIRAAAPGAVLVRHGSTRLVADAEGLWLNGEHWPLPDETKPLGTYLASRRLYSADALYPLLNTNGRTLINEWIEQGYFVALHEPFDGQ
jgi:50S ribosomal protein L16 3-hydroxylase